MFAQTLHATTRVLPQQQFKRILLHLAKERQRQARTVFYLVCIFFCMCIVILAVGILLFFIAPSSSTALTPIGTLLSVIGGLLVKSHRDANKKLDDIIDQIWRI